MASIVRAALLAACASSAAAVPLGAAKLGGANVVGEGFEAPFAFGTPEMGTALQALKATGAGWAQLSFTAALIASANSTGPLYTWHPGAVPTGAPMRNASTPTLASVAASVAQAQAAGLRVILRPMIDPDWNLPANNPDAVSRSAIGAHFTADMWPSWWGNYSAFLLPWARLGAQLKVDGFCLGAELASTEGQAQAWRDIAAAVRAVFSAAGQSPLVFYSATSPSSPFPWDVSDLIGVDVYADLTGPSVDPASATLPQLVAGWAGTLAGLQAASQRNGGKQVLLAESGICSVDKVGLYSQPWYFECYQWPVNDAVQAMYYESLFQAAWPQPWVAGVFFWKWALQGGPADPTFFPLNKTAAGIMSKYFGGFGGSS